MHCDSAFQEFGCLLFVSNQRGKCTLEVHPTEYQTPENADCSSVMHLPSCIDLQLYKFCTNRVPLGDKHGVILVFLVLKRTYSIMANWRLKCLLAWAFSILHSRGLTDSDLSFLRSSRLNRLLRMHTLDPAREYAERTSQRVPNKLR